jgi:hypothetical protein
MLRARQDALPARPRRLTFLAKSVLAGFGVTALAAALVTAVINSGLCAPGIERTDDEQCVGVVTTGAPDDVFGAGYADVLGRIQKENAAVEASGQPFVSVAYLLPLPAEGDDGLAGALRRDLVGAYVAQLRANHTRTLGEAPLVRLLVANHGKSAAHWERVVPTLVEMASWEAGRLVAVALGGQSLVNTSNALDALVRGRVPVLTGRLTADQLLPYQPGPDVPLARLAPTNTEEAVAASAYLRPTVRTAVIVQDSNPLDTYATSLGEAFRAAFPDATHEIVEPVEYFDSRTPAINTMPGILSNICLKRPDIVYFAGRSPELEALVEVLPFRPCLDLPIRIVTGSDGVLFAAAAARGTPELRRGLEANAEVIYTAVAHDGSWTGAPEAFQPAASEYLTGTCEGCLPRLFPNEYLADGAVIMGYDAIVTAVSAVRLGDGLNDTAALVSQQFKRMHGTEAVPGASGWLSFAATGEARDKATPVLRVRPDGSPEFLQLTSPDGVPCVPDGVSC